MSLNLSDLLSSPGAASLFDPSAQASTLTTLSPSNPQIDLSEIDFDYLTTCNNPQTLQSIVSQLEREPFPELLAAARLRLAEVEGEVGEVGRRRRECEEKDVVVSELEVWIRQQKQKERATDVDIKVARKQPPVRSSKPATAAAAEPAVTIENVVGGKEAAEAVMSEEEKQRRIASEKQKGNECYKAREYDTAAAHYTTAITLLPHPHNTTTTSLHPTSFTTPPATPATFDPSLHTNLGHSPTTGRPAAGGGGCGVGGAGGQWRVGGQGVVEEGAGVLADGEVWGGGEGL